jgi:lactoylglutathione lyase
MEERRQNDPETLRLRSVMPTLTVADVAASVSFYRDVMGFVVSDTIEHEGAVVGASIKAGVVEFLLGQDDFKKGRDREKGVGFRLYCVTHQDIDEVAENVKARGGTLDHEPVDQPWGTRDFAVTDPDGFSISISTPMPS